MTDSFKPSYGIVVLTDTGRITTEQNNFTILYTNSFILCVISLQTTVGFHCDCINVCRTLVPRSACGRRPVCQQHGQSPHTPPLGQEDSPGGTQAPSGSHWDPPQRSGPQQERPDQYLRGGRRYKALHSLFPAAEPNSKPLHPSVFVRECCDNGPVCSYHSVTTTHPE